MTFMSDVGPCLKAACGEILLSLSYLAKAQRLTVSVFKVRNLHQLPDMQSHPGSSLPSPQLWD